MSTVEPVPMEAEAAEEEWPRVPVLEPHHFETEPMESEHHLLAMMLFYTLMRERFVGRDDVFIGADLVCYFSDLQVKNKDFRAPDGMLVLGVEPRERKGWIVWEEGGRYPDLAIELMSPTTRRVDLGKKVAIYGNVWKVREYYALDLETGELHAYHQTAMAGFVRVTPTAAADGAGRVWSDVLDAWVGVTTTPETRPSGPWLRLFARDGSLIPTRAESAEAESQRAEAESQRAEAESQRAEAEHARAEALAAEVAALRAQLAQRGAP